MAKTKQKSRQRRKLRHLLAHEMAVDLGTANTLVSIGGQGIVINEPSVVARHKRTGRIVAIGSEAQAMVGRTPKAIVALHPLVDGVVSDFEVTEQMLKHFVDRLHGEYRVLMRRPRMIVGLPHGVTEVEKRAVEEAARSAGARSIYLIEEPIAAAMGAGLETLSERGCMVVDIGGGTTEIAVMANGGVVAAHSVRVAGDELTDTVINTVREDLHILIGERTAETLKRELGYVAGKPHKDELTVRGRNSVNGLPAEGVLRADVLRLPLTRQLRPVIEAIKTVLDEVPPEILGDVLERGITLTGGGSLIPGMAELVEQEARVPAHVSRNALTAVVEGAHRAIQSPSTYRDVLMTAQ